MTRSTSFLWLLTAVAVAAPGTAFAAPAHRADRRAAPAASAASTAGAHRARRRALPALSVDQIVARNVAARGGLAAWRAVTSLAMSGDMDAGGKGDPRLPFVMRMKRPHKRRLEITFQDQTAVQVWDGAHGWKVRPFLNRNEVEGYTDAEARSAAATAELDGPLVDYAAKGTRVELAGTDVVEGRDAYRLELTLKGGERRSLWIDATTFLEARIDGVPRRLDRHVHPVAVYYRDFRRVKGLEFPHTLETVVDSVKGSHTIHFTSIEVNPALDDALFTRPQLAAR